MKRWLFLLIALPLSATPTLIPKASYPWEKEQNGITKAYFRCKGSGEDPSDCHGFVDHGLPIRNGHEFIYPVLIELLNHIQNETGKNVVITSGHRCPKHNALCDPSKKNELSKHLLGAEVDFYVEGFEANPEAIIDLIIKKYETDSSFSRWKQDTNVRTPPWYNQELFIKLFQPDEGRNLDNNHSFPYIAIQVRRDRSTGERVNYTWKAAHMGYQRN